jgi:hypothetical protein
MSLTIFPLRTKPAPPLSIRPNGRTAKQMSEDMKRSWRTRKAKQSSPSNTTLSDNAKL